MCITRARRLVRVVRGILWGQIRVGRTEVLRREVVAVVPRRRLDHLRKAADVARMQPVARVRAKDRETVRRGVHSSKPGWSDAERRHPTGCAIENGLA